MNAHRKVFFFSTPVCCCDVDNMLLDHDEMHLLLFEAGEDHDTHAHAAAKCSAVRPECSLSVSVSI